MGTFIIAEIGINHNGDIDLAKKLIDASVDAGVVAWTASFSGNAVWWW
jgi:sialic acid synthase SpsE